MRRRVTRGTRTAGPSTAVLTAIAAVGVSAAVALLQLAPPVGPIASVSAGPTPLRVSPYQLAMLGQGVSDVAIYQLDVDQVCPVSGTLDCVPNQHFVRTPISLPSDVRAGNVALNAQGSQLAMVGRTKGDDVIAVVAMPNANGGKNDPGRINRQIRQMARPRPAPTRPSRPTRSAPLSRSRPIRPRRMTAVISPAPRRPAQCRAWPCFRSWTTFRAPARRRTGRPTAACSPSRPCPTTAQPVRTSTSGRPGDAVATPITTDHGSFFASWSGNRIVISRITAGSSKAARLRDRSCHARAACAHRAAALAADGQRPANTGDRLVRTTRYEQPVAGAAVGSPVS